MATAKKPAAKKHITHPRESGAAEKEMGQRIKLRRIERRISQQELGSILGLTFQQVQKYEKGVNRVAGTRVVQIARALATTPNYLHGWEDKKEYADVPEQTWKIAVEMTGLDKTESGLVMALVRAIKETKRPRATKA